MRSELTEFHTYLTNNVSEPALAERVTLLLNGTVDAAIIDSDLSLNIDFQEVYVTFFTLRGTSIGLN